MKRFALIVICLALLSGVFAAHFSAESGPPEKCRIRSAFGGSGPLNRVAPFLFCLALSAVVSGAKFTDKPVVERDGREMTVRFAVDKATDVAVAIVNKDGRTVRHLAAGMLGENAPVPLEAGSLAQAITWDGNDDYGKPVPPAECRVRVSLGLSVRFDRFIGDERQAFESISALAVGPDGEVFVHDDGQIVALDRDGKYLRQIKPYPADLPTEKLAGLGPATLPDGVRFMFDGYPTGKWTNSAIGAMAVSPDGKTLYLPSPPRYARNLTKIGTDGSVPADAFSTRLTTHADNGYLYLACSPDGKTLYFAGAQAGYVGDDRRDLTHRQSIYRLRLDAGDGPAEIFTGDDENSGTGFSVNDPKGLTTDPDGRVYVCNYGGDNVAVYTPGAGFIRSFEVPNPQQVAVNPETGQIYVLRGRESHVFRYGYHYPSTMHEAHVARFSPDGRLEQEITLEPPALKTRQDPETKEQTTQPEFNLRMAADFSQPANPIIWVGVATPSIPSAQWGLLRIEDLGDKFGQPRDVSTRARPQDDLRNRTAVQGMMSRMALDHQNHILYLNSGSDTFHRYDSLSGELMESIRLNDPTGETPNVVIYEPGVGPDGMIYFVGSSGGWASGWGVFRADPEGNLVPFPGPQPELTGRVTKGAGARTSRGFAVSRTGHSYVLYYDRANAPADKTPPERWDAVSPLKTAVTQFDEEGGAVDRHVIHYLRAGAGGVRVDSRGNIYVADNFMPLGVTYPADVAAVMPEDPLSRPYPARLDNARLDPLLRFFGSVLKFGPNGGRVVGLPESPEGIGIEPAPRPQAGDLYRPVPETQWFLFNYHKLEVTGAEWQFHGISPMPAEYQGVTHVERCVCRGARFDIDPFDRLFVPDALRSRITVLDSAGNAILQFGEYGNRDATGLRFAAPSYVAAGGDYAFIGDDAGRRLVRVNYTYAAEEEADLTAE